MSISGWCRPCSGADPVADTVSINPALIGRNPDAVDKENAQPNGYVNADAAALKLADTARMEKEEKERHEKEAALAEEAKRRSEEEQQRVLKEMEERQKEEMRQAEERLKLEEEQRQKQIKEEQERLEREAQASKQRAEAEAKKKDEELMKTKAKAEGWLKAQGFASVTAMKRTSILGAPKSALHVAVSQKDHEMVAALIKAGADSTVKVSGKTAHQLAVTSNKNGSHSKVIDAFTH